jgi:predicted O-methyltransferase YrrM
MGLGRYSLGIGAETGQFLRILVLSTGAKNVVEIGTAYGYSTLWLADAARFNGGKVTTFEFSSERASAARRNFANAGLDEHIDCLNVNALTGITEIPGDIDFVFMDGLREEYIQVFDLAFPKLRTGGLFVADNVIFPYKEELEPFVRHVQSHPRATSVTVPIGYGVELAVKQ